MFTSERVPVQIKNIALDVVERNDETHRIARVVFTIAPLSYALAKEIGESIAAHLFVVHPPDQHGDTPDEETYEARSEIVDVSFTVDVMQSYTMSLAPTGDELVDAVVEIERVACSKFKVKRDKVAPIFIGEFTASFVVESPTQLWRVIGQWHGDEKTFVTFVETEEPEQSLDFEGSNDDADRVH